MEKRKTIIDSVRQEQSNVLLLDSGDIFDMFPMAMRDKYVADVYRMLSYQAMAIGDQDFSEGLDFFRKFTAGQEDKVLNTNLSIEGKTPGKTYLVETFQGVRIGITATVDSNAFRYIDAKIKKALTFSDPISSLRPVVKLLEDKCDYRILLSHCGLEIDEELAKAYPQFDLIIGGHSQDLLETPVKIGRTLIVQAGNDGYHFGILNLAFKNKKLISYDNYLRLLDNTVRNDPEIANIISEYRQERQDYFLNRRKIRSEVQKTVNSGSR